MNHHQTADKTGPGPGFFSQIRWLAIGELLAITLLFAVQGSTLPPDVNEAHYLVKAKHFWDASFCPNDLFCNSADAHYTFYLTLGWLTYFFSLPVAAWIGRAICWLLLAVGWHKLCRAIAPEFYASWLSAGCLVVLWQYGHLAGEWVIGGVEAKSLSYGFVLLALGAWINRQTTWAGIWTGVAAALHVLVGGWLAIAMGLSWLLLPQERPPLKQILPGCLCFLAISSLGWLPAILLSSQADATIRQQANHIYVYERLSHHLVFHRFDHLFMLRHCALVGILTWCWWHALPCSVLRRLQSVCLGAALIALVGVLIDQALLYYPDVAAGLLRYYFFRLSDALVPVGLCLTLAEYLVRVRAFTAPIRVSTAAVVLTTCAALCLHLGLLVQGRTGEPLPPAILQTMPKQPVYPVRLWGPAAFWQATEVDPLPAEATSTTNWKQADDDKPPGSLRPDVVRHFETAAQRQEWFRQWRDVCGWIRESTQPTACFLTPRSQQTFKWYSHRSEVVNWKDVPQDAASLIAWHERWLDVHPPENGAVGLLGQTDAQLLALAEKYQADYLLVDRTRDQRPVSLPRLYPEFSQPGNLFEVYELSRPAQ